MRRISSRDSPTTTDRASTIFVTTETRTRSCSSHTPRAARRKARTASSNRSAVRVWHQAGHPNDGGNGDSEDESISTDGNEISFDSLATDLVSGFTDGNLATERDVFKYSVAQNTSTLVTHAVGLPTTSG